MTSNHARTTRLAQFAAFAAILGGTIAGAQDIAWRAGARMTSGGAETTNSLTLVAGETPATYVMPSVNASLKLSLTPATAEAAVPLTLASEEGGAQTFTAARVKGVTMTTRFMDAETFVVEVKATGRAGALVSAEVRQLDGQTTAPLTSVSSRPVLIIEGKRDAKILQVFSHNAFRMKNGDASLIVAPIDGEESLFISLGVRERTWKEITGRDEPERALSPFKSRPGR